MGGVMEADQEEAKRTGARIVFSCGFDSIPFDLGVLTLQEKAREKFGRPARRVKARLRNVQGGMSGGTGASPQAALPAPPRPPAPNPRPPHPFRLPPGTTAPSPPPPPPPPRHPPITPVPP